jgi:hypothetical protein
MRLLNFTVLDRRPVGGGTPVDNAAAYERLDCRALLRIDPGAAENAGIVDLDIAPRDADGLVAFATQVQILKPVEAEAGSRRLFVELCNRGNKRCLQFFNDARGTNDPITCADMGNGFLLRRGYTVVWIAWQGDILPGNGRITMDLPVAGSPTAPVTGQVRTEFIATGPGQTTFPLSGWASTRSHPAVSRNTTTARLVRRRYPGADAEAVPPDQWMFARVEGGSGLDNQGAETAIVQSDTHIHMPGGFAPGWIYELVYEGRDPLVMGLGHVAVRDVTAFLKTDEHDADGNPNPLIAQGRGIEKAYAWGRSQTGRYLRDFVHLGFNDDGAGNRVFDGIIPHVSGGGLMWFNHRFANAVRPAGQEYEEHITPADRFPFSYAETTDHLTGATDAILKRPATDPLVLHTQTATEYWQRRGSLVHTTTDGQDLEQPDGVRVYLWASSQHFADPLLTSSESSICREAINVVATSMLFRAMLDAMDAWATNGTEPPASRIPRRADGTLCDYEEWTVSDFRTCPASCARAARLGCRVSIGARTPIAVSCVNRQISLPTAATRSKCRQQTRTATTSPVSAPRWSRRLWQPTPAGTFAVAGMATARCTNSPDRRSRFPRPRVSGVRRGIRVVRSLSATPARMTTSRPFAPLRRRLWRSD